MRIERASIPDICIVRPARHGDERGFFSETFKASAFKEAGIDRTWLQDNHVYSRQRGVVRGLHFQNPPAAQAKLLRVTRGAVFDVAVDIRRGSPFFGGHVAVELSADNWAQIFVPEGFAHGYCTLTDETEVLYKVSCNYAPACEGGLRWDDPELAIQWPVDREAAIYSERDLKWPCFADFTSSFVFGD